MTTEIVIMNRRALVLAADSAGTVTSWVNGTQETRYFKGENKVFQLVTDRPVGLLTFGNAHVMHVPWDVVIKEFRRTQSGEALPSVEAYAQRFFSHLEGDHIVFPSDQREADFKARIGQQIFRLAIEIFAEAKVAEVPDLDSKKALFKDHLLTRKAEIVSRETHPPFTVGDVEKAISDLSSDAEQACRELFPDEAFRSVVSGLEDILFETAINLVYRNPADVASSTGIVIAGYGERSVFPSLVEYRVFGFVREKLLYEAVASRHIDARNTGDIQSYASTNMVETFTHGVNVETFGRVTSAFHKASGELLDTVEKEAGIEISDRDTKIQFAHSAFSKLFVTDIVGQHNQPLVNVVSMLAIDEMANLAETLISLESLKEKVTRPTESVGGPVDIAAITKAEGLVWIKRKHYFDLATNPRYAAKLNRSGGQE